MRFGLSTDACSPPLKPLCPSIVIAVVIVKLLQYRRLSTGDFTVNQLAITPTPAAINAATDKAHANGNPNPNDIC